MRSSSLLEDRCGTAFSGKYKSLFLANQGSKEERLDALMDADRRGLRLDLRPRPDRVPRASAACSTFHEEMGILIQEVVGTRVGRYFLPAFAGVAFSNNEFRWSPRIQREDGLVRLVPGAGHPRGGPAERRLPDAARARASPALRVNVTVGRDSCATRRGRST